MKRTIAMLTASAALWGGMLAAAPSLSSAALQASPTSYSTVMTQTQPLPSAGVLAGRLNISVGADGIVGGWYVPEDGTTSIVTGVQQGDSIRLEIGSSGSLRIYGTITKDGSIIGSATQYPDFGVAYGGIPPSYDFVARPN